MRSLALIVLLAGGIASADVWQRAVDGEPPGLKDYDTKLHRGDQLALQANMRGIASDVVKRDLRGALQAYREAAAAKPQSGEPYYRIAQTLYSFYFDCTGEPGQVPVLCTLASSFDADTAKQFVAAMDAFEARAPLDPRLSCLEPGHTPCLRFERAIIHTKLGNLAAAATDYEALVRRAQPDERLEVVMGNLAETYMMLNRLDDSIDLYKETIHRFGGDSSTTYGLAVALDRDERGLQARDKVLGVGPEGYRNFRQRVALGEAFFVPRGEVEYYFALIEESFDHPDEAIGHWRRYIASGAHPQFQPRAKAHLDALLQKLKNRPPAPPPPLDDLLFIP